MSRSHTHGWSALAAIVVLFLAATTARAQGQQARGASSAAATPPDTAQVRLEIGIEGAFVMPAGDLAASFDHTERGFSAGPGYCLGLRVHWHAARALVISPAFHFMKFGEHEDYDEAATKFTIATSAVLFGLDVLYQAPGPYAAWRPFVGLGVELAQNRYQETFVADESTYEATVNALGPRLSAGVRRGDFEFGLSLRWSRFSTPRFFATGEDTGYSWDTAQFTIGYVLPRI